nr:hypothetical protein [uncultured Clostridium sp.]
MINAEDYGNKVIGPIMYEYISWILQRAQERNINKLYFLARDGYLLKQMAEALCKKNGYHIQCKYLYCSRMALRMPSYHFIGDEAYDLLLQGGYHITPYTLMNRLNLNSEERIQVYKEIGVIKEHNPLTQVEFNKLIERVRESRTYREFMYRKSTESYDNTIGYFKQEGLFDDLQIAIIDSGWSGSMQRSLRQLLEKEGYQGRIIGFYFGMYNEPKEVADGEYETYYFNAFTNMKHKVYFDNTFFECLLSAPHGMTIGFSFDGQRYQPILKSNMNVDLTDFIQCQISGALKYALEVEKHSEFKCTDSVKRTYRVLKRAVIYPTKDEIEIFSIFKFSDDVSEDNMSTLIQKDMLSKLKNYMLIPKIIGKMIHMDDIPIDNIFWPYGVITYIRYPVRLWYRLNISLLQLFRYMRTAIKEKRRILNYEKI